LCGYQLIDCTEDIMKVGISVKRNATLVAGLTAVATLLAPMPTHACEFIRTPWGLQVLRCSLAELFKGKYDLAVELNPRPELQLNLPNLVPIDIDTVAVGSSVNIEVDIENRGIRAAPIFEVAAVGTVHDPLNNGTSVSTTPLPPRMVQGLAVGGGTDVPMGSVYVPNGNQDWDVCTMTIVDPPPMAGQAWGRVLESDESDNVRTHCCRVYGPKPDTSVQAC
jgi:hypothetical protein